MKCMVCREEILPDIIWADEWCPLCRHLSAMGLPNHYLRAQKADFEPSRQKLFESRESLFIHGPAGTGKTWLASALMRERVRASGKRINHYILFPGASRFISLPEFAIMIRAARDRYAEPSEPKIMERYGDVQTLFLDDVGAEGASPTTKSALHVLLERRNTMFDGRTVITSNMSLKELNDEHGPRIASRISEMCRAVKMTGVDRRIRKEGK